MAKIFATSKAISVPKPTATAAKGWTRRHNNVSATTTLTVSTSGRHARSWRSSVSSTDHATSTATSAQSRHTRTGGCAGRGSAHSARRTFPTMTTA